MIFWQAVVESLIDYLILCLMMVNSVNSEAENPAEEHQDETEGMVTLAHCRA